MTTVPSVRDSIELASIPGNADECYGFVAESCLGPALRVRITIEDGRAVLRASFQGAMFFFPPLPEHSRSLTEEEWARLRAALAMGFWYAPEDDEWIGLDGEQWTFEGVKDGVRHRVSRWSPRDEAVLSLGHLFSELSGLPLPGDTH